MTTPRRREMPTWAFTVAALAVALLLACVVSSWASSHPDGLEYVAAETGIVASDRSAVLGSPLADYQTPGMADGWPSTAIAGLLGCVVVFASAWLLDRGLRRKRI